MPASSGYIGAGNKTSVFNRKPKVPFEKIRTRLDLEFESANHGNPEKKRLSQKEREQIKARVREQIRVDRRKEIFYVAMALLFGLLLIFLASTF